MNKWESEKDYYTYERFGLRCVIQRMPETLHLCGYVGVNKNHRLYGMGYSDRIKMNKDRVDFNGNYIGLLCADPKDVSMGFIPLDLFFQVHGGLTWAGKFEDRKGFNPDLWYFGFDCAHAGDLSPGAGFSFSGSVYRDADFVLKEVFSLADQLRDYDFKFEDKLS